MLSPITKAARKRDDLAVKLSEADLDLARLMTQAHDAGHTWTAIAEAAGLKDPEAARWKAHAGREGVAGRNRHTSIPAPAPLPGVTITEAASRLGLSRQGVYYRIEKGLLETVLDHHGRTRVVLPNKTDDLSE